MKNSDLHLLAFYVRQPKDPKKTFVKDFGKDQNNWSYSESVHLTRGLRSKDLERAQVILNVSQQKVVKCTFNRDASFISLFNYFEKSYPQYFGALDEAFKEKQVAQIAQESETVEEPKEVADEPKPE